MKFELMSEPHMNGDLLRPRHCSTILFHPDAIAW